MKDEAFNSPVAMTEELRFRANGLANDLFNRYTPHPSVVRSLNVFNIPGHPIHPQSLNPGSLLDPMSMESILRSPSPSSP